MRLARPNPPLRGPSRVQAIASTSETADVFVKRTLKRNREDAYKSKDQARHQASHRQSSTIASHQFRHFSPLLLCADPTRGPGTPCEGLAGPDRSRSLADLANVQHPACVPAWSNTCMNAAELRQAARCPTRLLPAAKHRA